MAELQGHAKFPMFPCLRPAAYRKGTNIATILAMCDFSNAVPLSLLMINDVVGQIEC